MDGTLGGAPALLGGMFSVAIILWRSRSPLIDIDGVGGRPAFAPVVVEGRDARELGKRRFVDPLSAGRRARLLGEDSERGVADDLRRAPLRAVGHAEIDRGPALDNRTRPERIAGDVVLAVLRGETNCEASHAELGD